MANPDGYLEPDEVPTSFYHGQVLKFTIHTENADYFNQFFGAEFYYTQDPAPGGEDVALQVKWEMVRCIKRPATAGPQANQNLTIEVHVRAVSPRQVPSGCLLAPLNLLSEDAVHGLLHRWRLLRKLFGRPLSPIGSGSGSGLGSNDDPGGKGGNRPQVDATGPHHDKGFLDLTVRVVTNQGVTYNHRFPMDEI